MIPADAWAVLLLLGVVIAALYHPPFGGER